MIVALPIAIVTSWVLYERCKLRPAAVQKEFVREKGLMRMGDAVVKGEERKMFPRHEDVAK